MIYHCKSPTFATILWCPMDVRHFPMDTCPWSISTHTFPRLDPKQTIGLPSAATTAAAPRANRAVAPEVPGGWRLEVGGWRLEVGAGWRSRSGLGSLIQTSCPLSHFARSTPTGLWRPPSRQLVRLFWRKCPRVKEVVTRLVPHLKCEGGAVCVIIIYHGKVGKRSLYKTPCTNLTPGIPHQSPHLDPNTRPHTFIPIPGSQHPSPRGCKCCPQLDMTGSCRSRRGSQCPPEFAYSMGRGKG